VDSWVPFCPDSRKIKKAFPASSFLEIFYCIFEYTSKVPWGNT